MNNNTKLSVFIFAALLILFLLFVLAGAVGATRTEPDKGTPTLNGPCVCAPPVTPFPTPTYDKRKQSK